MTTKNTANKYPDNYAYRYLGKNVTYKNITVEDAQMLGDDRNDGENDFLIDFKIANVFVSSFKLSSNEIHICFIDFFKL